MKHRKIISVQVILFLFLNLFYQTIFSGLPKDTLVVLGTTPISVKKIQDISIEDQILSVKEREDGLFEFVNTKIKAISKEIKKRELINYNLILLETSLNNSNNGQLLIDSESQFYNSKTKSWTNCVDLSLEDKLLDVNLNEISIDKIIKENSDVDIEVYELSLEEPHCYFVCDSAENPILIHNMDQIFMTAGDKAEPIIETIVSAGVTLFGLAKSLGLFDKKKKQEDKKQLPKVAENNKTGTKTSDNTKKTDDKKAQDKYKIKNNNPDLDEILDRATEIKKQKGPSKVYEKSGQNGQKEKDFNKLNKGNVEYKKTSNGTIKLGKTVNGEQIIDRDFSSDRSGDKPTLEIQVDRKFYIKIRYN